MNIQWYPGHMTKTRRMIEQNLSRVDLICEIVDARIPISSRNPDLNDIAGSKPRLIVMNRTDQADPEATKQWRAYFVKCGIRVLETDSKSGSGTDGFVALVKSVLRDKINKYNEKGQTGRTVKTMVVGVPNVGKSSFINRITRRRVAKTEDRPGVTRSGQWVTISEGIELMDTPGILWPKFENAIVGMNLAFTGAVRDDIIDTEELSANLLEVLRARYPDSLALRYGIRTDGEKGGYELLKDIAIKRGFISAGAEPDLGRTSKVFLDEFRSGKLGRITLELPEDLKRIVGV